MVYPDLETYVSYSIGVGILSAILKRNGHEVKVLHLNEEIGYPLDYSRIKKDIEDFKPELIAFSSTSNQFSFVKKISRFIKKEFSMPIICGGVHATTCPDEVISVDEIDFLCRGEGDIAFLEFTNKLEKKQNVTNVKGIWAKSNGNIIRNPVGPVVEDLDSLPFPDRDVIHLDKILQIGRGWVNILAGRGCPYTCAYCVNHFYTNFYKNNKIKYPLRYRSVENVLEEISLIVKNKNVKMINFNDDTFALDKDWSLKFCDEYPKRFKLPFSCNIRVTNFDEEIAMALKRAGCEEVKIGVESGNERIRKDILNRYTPDHIIFKAFSIAKRAGLRTWSFNMIGIPTETRENILETVKMNAKMRPYIIRVSILYPYRGTKIYDYCLQKNMIDKEKEDKYSTYFEGSILKMDSISQVEILKFKKMFKWYVDAYSEIEVSPFFMELVKNFEQLPEEFWESGRAQRMVSETDKSIDNLFRAQKKQHYTTRRQLDLDFCKELSFQLP
jgi:anaerobic magnesium-protoporphyrin IX monomethyl ester cyclase